MKFYTIGYGGRMPQEFLNLLKERGVRTIVDVRIRPDRAYMGCYAQAKSPDKGIQGLLKTAGIEYFSLVELGNMFLDHEDWREKYRQLLEKAGDLLFCRLEQIPTPFCLLCAEKKAEECHRQLIADYLIQKGSEVEHIE